jgi:MFS transporter, DHA1 family, inner membrane transport protein
VATVDKAMISADGPQTSTSRAMIILLILALVQFTSIVDFMVVMPLGPVMIEELSIRADQFSMIVASYSISAGVAGLLASSIMDRFGRKLAYMSLFAGFLVGTLACGLTNSYATLVAARALTGAFGGILGGLGLTIVADVFPEEQRGRATGLLMSAFALASVVGVPVGLQLGTLFRWQAPFLVLAGLGSIIFIAGLLVMPPLREHLHHAGHSHPISQIIATFRQPGNLIAFALTATVMLGAFTVIPFISLSLVGNAGVPKTRLWLVFLTGGLLTLAGAPLIGAMADRYGKLLVFRIVASISAVLIGIVTNLPVVPLVISIGVVGLLMVSNAGRMTVAMSMITASVSSRVRGGLMSANSAVQHVAAGFGAYLSGKIVVHEPSGVLRNFKMVGLIAIAATIFSLWLAGRIKPTVEKPSGVIPGVGDDWGPDL